MEASNDKNQVETTATPIEEGWIEVPSKRAKKIQQQQQAVNQGVKAGSPKSGRGPKPVQIVNSADEEQKAKWTAIEEELKPKVVTSDDFDWSLQLGLAAKKSPEADAPQAGQPSNTWSKVLFGKPGQAAPSAVQRASNKPLSLIGGAHLSYYKNTPKKKDFAVASLVVCSFPSLEVVYEAVKEQRVEAPFISGFHSFRDTVPLVALFNELKDTKPELVPQIIFVDGPGVLYKGFGLATHLGVLLDVPTIGVTKKFFNVDGLNETTVRKIAQDVQRRGEAIEIIGRNSGSVLGAAMRTTEGQRGNYAYISIGHRISLPTAVEVVREASTGKVPQPVYSAEQKVKQELLKLDPKLKKAVNVGKNAGGNNNNNRRNSQGGNRQGGKKEGGNRGAANGKAQDGKLGQGKRPRGPGQQLGGQQGNKGPRAQGQGPRQGGQQGQGQQVQGQQVQGQQVQGQQGQGQQGQRNNNRQGGNKGPRGQGQQQQGGAGQQGPKRTGGPRAGNRPQGPGAKGGNVWAQKNTSPATPAAQPQAQAAPAAGQQPKQGGQQQPRQGGQQPKKQQPQGEKGGEKQQPVEKKD